MLLLLLTACQSAALPAPTAVNLSSQPPTAEAPAALTATHSAGTPLAPMTPAPTASPESAPTKAAPTKAAPANLEPTSLPPEAWPDRFNADSRPIDFSADGRLLLLESDRPLIAGEETSASGQAVPWPAVYLYDRQAETYERLSAQGRPLTAGADLSPDGRWVVFHDSPDGAVSAVYLLDRQSGAVEQISVTSAGEPADGNSLGGQVSADGRYVIFESAARNLAEPGSWAPGAGDVGRHIYLRDCQAGATVQLDRAPAGGEASARAGQGLGGASYAAVMTPDARFVAFFSDAVGLSDSSGECGGAECRPGLFVLDRASGAIERVPASQEPLMGGPSERASLSADGRYVAFHAYGPEPGDYTFTVRIYDRQSGATETICAPENGVCAGHSAEISADGRYVAFANAQMYRYDSQTKELTLLSKGLDGLPGRGESGMVQRYEGYYAELELSADGSAAAFVSDAHSLLPGGAEGIPVVKAACTYYPVSMVYPCRDVFVYDSGQPGLEWVTRMAQPGIRLRHSALIPLMPEVLLEIAPPVVYIHAGELIRQSGGRRDVLAEVSQAGVVLDALQAGDWIMIAGSRAALRVPAQGGDVQVLQAFDPPVSSASLAAAPDGSGAAAVNRAADSQGSEVWFFPSGAGSARKIYATPAGGESAIRLLGLRGEDLYLLPSHPFNTLLRIDVNSAESALLEIGQAGGCCEAALAPDGKTLAVFQPGLRGAGAILRVDLSGEQPSSELIPLPFPPHAVDGFQWSPDGQYLYFTYSFLSYSFLPAQPADAPFGVWRLAQGAAEIERVATLENEYGAPVTLSADGLWYWLHMPLASALIAVDAQSGDQTIFPLPEGAVYIVREQ